MAKKKPKITKRDQEIVASILTQFMFTKDMDEVIEVVEADLRGVWSVRRPIYPYPVYPRGIL